MKSRAIIAILFVSTALLAGCGAATQKIPVSSNPTGATVYTDGTQACMTPCNLELEKTQPHILTFQKEGYKQADVQISRKYDTGSVTRNAVQTGTQQKSWGASTEAAVSNALLSTEMDEQDGNAYVLTPSSVVVTLVPNGQPGKSGIAATPATPQEASQAQVETTEPATAESAVKENPEKAAEELLESAATAAPTIHTEKEVGHSHHSSTHMNEDGSMETHSSSSSTSVGASINPVEAGIGLLHLLEGAEKKEEDTTAE